MKSLLIVFPLVFLALSHCGKLEEPEGPDVPGKGNKLLSDAVKQEIGLTSGAMGDLQFVIMHWDQPQVMDALKVRRQQRHDLRSTLSQNRCIVRDLGALDSDQFQFELLGGTCPSRLRYQHNRRVLTETSTSRVELTQFSNSFQTREATVGTVLKQLDFSGEYREILETVEQGTILRKEADIEASGYSRVVGYFQYKMQERWAQHQEGPGSAKGVVYSREDDLLVRNRYQATVYREEIVEDGKPQSRGFYLNGERITELEYLELMQDLHPQLGVKTFE